MADMKRVRLWLHRGRTLCWATYCFMTCHGMLEANYFSPFFINLLLIQSGQRICNRWELYCPKGRILRFYFEGSVMCETNCGSPPKDNPRRWLPTWVHGQQGYTKCPHNRNYSLHFILVQWLLALCCFSLPLSNLSELINNDFFNAFSLVHIIMWNTVFSP